MTLALTLGNKNYSSWSMRPWIAMKVAGIAFEETVISLDAAEFKPTLLRLSPVGKVPVLSDGGVHVWESLAILEYLAEKFPAAKLWPAETKARAHARAIANEMHAGFVPLRRHCPMNFWRPVKKRELTSDVAANVSRIDDMWSHCRATFGNGGPFLFGTFTAADAMYAPVVLRFNTYGAQVSEAARWYMAGVLEDAALQEWLRTAKQETWTIPSDEGG